MAAQLGLATAFCLGPEILDRVVASVDDVAILASQVEREYRLERFLDGQWPPPPPDAATLAQVRERLTDQVLLRREDNSTAGDQAAAKKRAEIRLTALRERFAQRQDFQAALQSLGLTEAQLVAHMLQADRMLHLIDQRLRPAASPGDDAVRDYYRQNFVPEFRKKNPGAATPPFDDVEDQIREVLSEKRINELLEQWIEELKSSSRVQFHSF